MPLSCGAFTAASSQPNGRSPQACRRSCRTRLLRPAKSQRRSAARRAPQQTQRRRRWRRLREPSSPIGGAGGGALGCPTTGVQHWSRPHCSPQLPTLQCRLTVPRVRLEVPLNGEAGPRAQRVEPSGIGRNRRRAAGPTATARNQHPEGRGPSRQSRPHRR